MGTYNTPKIKRDVYLAATGSIFIAIFILSTNPQQLSVPFLLVMPILVALTSYRFIKLAIVLFGEWSSGRIRQLSLILSAGPTLVVLLGSLSLLGLQDFILSMILVVGISWYLRHLQVIGRNDTLL